MAARFFQRVLAHIMVKWALYHARIPAITNIVEIIYSNAMMAARSFQRVLVNVSGSLPPNVAASAGFPSPPVIDSNVSGSNVRVVPPRSHNMRKEWERANNLRMLKTRPSFYKVVQKYHRSIRSILVKSLRIPLRQRSYSHRKRL